MSPELQGILQQLRQTELGKELVDLINEKVNPHQYYPGKKDSNEQADAWKFYSGCEFERDRILKILTLR